MPGISVPSRKRRSQTERRAIVVVPEAEDMSPLFMAFLKDSLSLAAMPTIQAMPLLAGKTDSSTLPTHLPEAVTLIPQHDGCFEEQIAPAIHYTIDHFSPTAVCVIGSATPHLPPVFLAEAFGLLGNSDTDAVFGLREEGGFYLVGVKRPLPELFSDLPWNHSNVLAVTLERAAQIGLKVALLPGWYGLGKPEGLAQFQRDILRGVVTAPGTAATLGL